MEPGTALSFITGGAGFVVGSYAIYLGKVEKNHSSIATGGFTILMAISCFMFALDDLMVANFV